MPEPNKKGVWCAARGRLEGGASEVGAELWRGAATPRAGVLLVPGLGGVIDAALRGVASVFAAAGWAALIVDRPGFGTSGGEPRQDLDPERDVAAFVAALDELIAREGLAAVGVWGTSFGAIEAALVAAAHPAVAALVAQAPPGPTRRAAAVEDELRRVVERDRAAGRAPRCVPLVAAREGAPCAIPGDDAWAYFTAAPADGWVNQITLASLLRSSAIDPAAALARATVPALAIGVDGDARALAAGELPSGWRTWSRPGQHFALYDALLDDAAHAAAAFFAEHLPGATP